jgi:tetratricopeptide (TPR) repeat protein
MGTAEGNFGENSTANSMMKIEYCARVRRLGMSCLLLSTLTFMGCMRSPEVRRDKYLASGKKLVQRKDYTRAMLEFRNAVKAMPRDAESYYQLGLAYLALNDGVNGFQALKKATELNPSHAGAQLKIAQLLGNTGDPGLVQDSERRLQTLLTKNESDPDTLNTLAFTELRLGKTREAGAYLAKALATSPQFMSYLLLANTKTAEGDTKGAEGALQEAVRWDPKSSDAVIMLGWFYASLNRGNEAEAQFQKALSANPKSAAALFGLARNQYAMGRMAEAEQDFKRLAASPEKEYQHLYAMLLFEEHREPEGINELERLAKRDPSDRAARTRLLAAYMINNRGADAEKILDEVLAKNPKDLDALLQRGELYLAIKRYGAAEADFNLVVRLQANSPEVHYLLGKLHQARGSQLIYTQELNEALRLNPMLLPVRLELAENLLANRGAQTALKLLDETPESQKQLTAALVARNWALWSLGNLPELRKGIDVGLAHERSLNLLIQDGLYKLKTGNPSAARTSIEEALRINSSDVRALSALNQTYVAQKQTEAALEKVQEYAAQQPKSAPVQQFLGFLLVSDGKRKEARQAFLAAKAADSDFQPADLSLAQLDVLENNWDAAQKRLQDILASHADNSTARVWAGSIAAMRGDLAGAVEHLRRVVEISPDNPQALNNLAYLLAEYRQKPDEALAYAEKAHELAPDNPELADTLGWVLYRKGLYREALPQLERAASQSPNAVWKYHLAMAYAKFGDQKRGRAALDAALKLNPNVPEAKMAQALLGGDKK